MKLVFPDIQQEFETDNDYVNVLVIENQHLLCTVINDIHNQLLGMEGRSVLSEKGKILNFSKNVEFLFQFVPFDINQKTLINKATTALVKTLISEEYFQQTMELMSQLESFLLNASFALTGNMEFTKVNPETIIKSSGISFSNDYNTLAEKIVDYFELVSEYDKDKLFILFNFRSFITDEELELFADTVLRHNYHIIMIESAERKFFRKERRYIIDEDLCEIS